MMAFERSSSCMVGTDPFTRGGPEDDEVGDSDMG
jgi:hypothetical protein